MPPLPFVVVAAVALVSPTVNDEVLISPTVNDELLVAKLDNVVLVGCCCCC